MIFNCPEVLGGSARLEFYLLSETSNWPTVVHDTNTDQIEFDPEDVEIEAALDYDSIQPIVEQKTGENGSIWDANISLSFITRSEALDQLMDQYQNKPGVAILCLNTGFKKLIGTNLEPLYMNFDVNEGVSVDDANAGTKLKIVGKQRQRPMYIPS